MEGRRVSGHQTPCSRKPYKRHENPGLHKAGSEGRHSDRSHGPRLSSNSTPWRCMKRLALCSCAASHTASGRRRPASGIATQHSQTFCHHLSGACTGGKDPQMSAVQQGWTIVMDAPQACKGPRRALTSRARCHNFSSVCHRQKCYCRMHAWWRAFRDLAFVLLTQGWETPGACRP